MKNTSYHLYEDETKQRLSDNEEDVLEIHFIEMSTFLKQWNENKLSGVDDILARWLLLLGMVDGRKEKVYENIYRELEELAMNDETLIDAFNVWEELSHNPAKLEAYRARLKYMIDEEAKISDTLHRGRMEGKKEGIKEGRQTEQKAMIRRLLMKKQDVETIVELTGFDKELIVEVQRGMEQ